MHNLAKFIEHYHILEAYCVYCMVYIYYLLRTKIPLVGTSAAARQTIVEQIRAEIQLDPTKKIKVYDLGSGLGGVCLAIGRNFPAAEVVGIELGLPYWLFAVLWGKLCGRKNVRFLKGDFWQYNISDGNIIICYLGTKNMPAISEKLWQDACPNRLIISNTFPLPEPWQPIAEITLPKVPRKPLMVYRQ